MTVKSEARTRCFFDLEVDGVPQGRVIFELFSDVCPRTAENFRALCTGENGLGQQTQQPLHYQGVKLHRIVRSFMIQGGDFSAGNGTGGESIYGGTFDDENFVLEHDRPFLLSMANRGENTNGSQFFLTTQPAPHLNGVHVVFGHVVSGQEVVSQVEAVPTDNKSRPLQDVRIARCGELVLQSKHKDKKKKRRRDRIVSSDEEGRKKKKKKQKKKKKKTVKDIRSEASEEGEVAEESTVEQPPNATTSIDPEEIPAVPASSFLERVPDRGRQRRSRSPDGRQHDSRAGRQRHRPPYELRAGKKVKGRGFLRYNPEMARSRSRTPPHWRVAQKRTIKLSQFERLKEQECRRAEEIKTREEQRQKRHAERDLREQQRRERRRKEQQQLHRRERRRGVADDGEGEVTERRRERPASVERERHAATSGPAEQRSGTADDRDHGGGEAADMDDIHDRLDYEGGGDDADESADEDDAGRLLRLIQERQKSRTQDEGPQAATTRTGESTSGGVDSEPDGTRSPGRCEAKGSRSTEGEPTVPRSVTLHCSRDNSPHSSRKRHLSYDKGARSPSKGSEASGKQSTSPDINRASPEKTVASGEQEVKPLAKQGTSRTDADSRSKRSCSRERHGSRESRSRSQSHRSRSRSGHRRRRRSRERGSRRSRDHSRRSRRSRSRDRRSRSRNHRSRSRNRRSRSRGQRSRSRDRRSRSRGRRSLSRDRRSRSRGRRSLSREHHRGHGRR